MHSVCITRNPYSGEILAEHAFVNEGEIAQTVSRSVQTFEKWRHSSAWERSKLLSQAADILESDKEEFANLICQEAGKPIQLARIEVDRGIGVLRWAASEAQRFGGELLRLDATASGRPGLGIHTRFPRGVILGITPFNFPLNLVLHKVAPALASGCTILIKPSPYTALTALRLEKIFAGLQPNLMQVILADDSGTERLTRAREVAMISFTGSARIGWLIRKQAPEKPTTLELGGNAWVIVLEDTPESLFPAIAKRICGAAYGYAGQSCISVQNAAISKEIWPRLESHLRAATESTPFGDPKLAQVITGPVINLQSSERIRSALEGASRVTTACLSRTQEGFSGILPQVIPPTLLSIQEESQKHLLNSLIQEEIFAPVMISHRFEKLDDLIHQINSSRYGLQAGVYTQHWPTIEKLYRELEVGGLVVNDVPTSRYDHQPYGGVKDSGQGREGVKYAMEEMTESKFLALSSQIS